MGLVIKCPYYQSDKRKTITCEGCLKHFSDVEKKKGYLKNICETNYENCSYFKSLKQLYIECESLEPKEKSLKLKSFYLDSNKKTVKHLIQQIGIMDKNIERNIEVKQNEIAKLRVELTASNARTKYAFIELAAMMYRHNIELINLEDIVEFIKKYDSELVPEKDNPKIVKLVVTERGSDEHKNKTD
ncbi:hypothetical protein M2140_001948 [Clostridiales Family XIII bacterium PM5-7]